MESSDIFEKEIYHKFKRCPHCNSFSIKKINNHKNNSKRLTLKSGKYQCINCSNIFYQNGNKKVAPKESLISKISQFLKAKQPYLIGLMVFIVFLYIISNLKKESKGNYSEEPPPLTKTQKITKPKILKKQPLNQQIIKSNTKLKEIPIKYQEISLGKNKIFGVNWIISDKGLKITRLNNGPFKKAGLKVNDIISNVEGKNILDEKQLLGIRDQIFSQKKEDAKITVIRENKIYYYKILK